jgi:hypothetical protein
MLIKISPNQNMPYKNIKTEGVHSIFFIIGVLLLMGGGHQFGSVLEAILDSYADSQDAGKMLCFIVRNLYLVLRSWLVLLTRHVLNDGYKHIGYVVCFNCMALRIDLSICACSIL